jgi:hypothetical protein
MTRALVGLTVGASLALGSPAFASPPDVELPDVAPDDIESEPESEPARPEGPEPPPEEPSSHEQEATASPPPPKVDAEIIRVAVGLTPEALGTKDEKAILDRLEQSVRASSRPKTSVRRLRAGSSEPRRICREGTDDLVIAVGYMPEDVRPVLISHDCRIDEELPARSAQAAADPDLVGVLWQEHRERVAQGAKERNRRISPRLRNGLIIGGAAIVIGVAIGLLLASTLRSDTVVLKVAP